MRENPLTQATIIPPVFQQLTLKEIDQIAIPLFLNQVPAGFPSPADDYLEDKIDLQQLLVQNRSSTFFLRVIGDSMRDSNIHDGDILIVDRSKKATEGRVIIGVLDGEFTVKRLVRQKKRLFLQPENPVYPAIEITEGMDFQVWGVVTWCIHKQ